MPRARWGEHFRLLLNQGRAANREAIDPLPQYSVEEALNTLLGLDDIMISEKSSGL